jgi:hypothetical protein
LCSEGGEWIWLGASQSRPGQSKRISAIVRLEEHRREPLLRRSVASLSIIVITRPTACFPGHGPATVRPLSLSVAVYSHRHMSTSPSTCLPPALPWQDEAEFGPITASMSTTGPRQQPQSSLACRQLADLGPLASDSSLVTQGLPKCPRPALASQRGIQSPTTPSRIHAAQLSTAAKAQKTLQSRCCVMPSPKSIGIHPEQKATGFARATSGTNLLASR